MIARGHSYRQSNDIYKVKKPESLEVTDEKFKK
jgi:hypothetical protein